MKIYKDNKYLLIKRKQNEKFNYWLQTILINRKFSKQIDKVLEKCIPRIFF